jgi:hypothetical protein
LLHLHLLPVILVYSEWAQGALGAPCARFMSIRRILFVILAQPHVKQMFRTQKHPEEGPADGTVYIPDRFTTAADKPKPSTVIENIGDEQPRAKGLPEH